MTGGYDIDENAVRFSNYLAVLRELVHRSCGHLALEPRFEVKCLLADHLHDDARAVTEVRARLDELRDGGPGGPSPELAALLDRAGSADGTSAYLEIAYGELKPTLIAAIRIHLANLDPLADEPSLRLLTELLHRQERHAAELPAERPLVAIEDLGALPPGEPRALTPAPPIERPARDEFVEVVATAPELDPAAQGRYFHALMNAELCAAEVAARTAHEHPELPWAFHLDMARRAWDGIRHAEIHDRAMTTELGCHWGDHPVSLEAFTAAYARDLPARLERAEEPPWRDSPVRAALIERGQANLARALDYIHADAARHATGATPPAGSPPA